MKQIPNLDKYFATEQGDIYSTQRGRPKKMVATVDTSKYKRLQLRTKEGVKSFLVHRLVALTYLPNPLGLPQVNHKDGDKLNNHVDNLEWVTASDNMKHAYEIGIKSSSGESNSRSLFTEDQVLQIYYELLDGARISDLAKKYSSTKGRIGSIKDRTNWTYLLKDLPPIKMQSKREAMSDNTVRWICHRLQEGMQPTPILKLCENKNITVDQIYSIKARKTHTRISKDFHW